MQSSRCSEMETYVHDHDIGKITWKGYTITE